MKLFNDYLFRTFAIWRTFLLVIVSLSPLIFNLNTRFLGGGVNRYLRDPVFWSAANFDGAHYLRIAMNGYRPLLHFFFPVYPLLTSALTFSNSIYSYALVGQLISNFSIIVAIYGLWKLVRLDHSVEIGRYAILLLLLYPTSFYFTGVYTESLFLALVVWVFYFARKKDWLLASLLAGIASGTRIIGIIMLPVLFIEWASQNKNERKNRDLLFLLLSSLGLLIYMYYLQTSTGNFLTFKTGLEAVYGEQRSDTLVLLPQVLYRYLFKIIPSMNWNYFEGAFSFIIEFSSGILFLILSVIGYFKLRKSYWLYMIAGYLIPTFSGSFSSMSRYVLILFPGFILLANYISSKPKIFKIAILTMAILLLTISTALFSRGYWIA